MKVTRAILTTGLVGHAAATWNMFENPFNSPNYNNNECSDKQKAGFDWSDLKDGDSNFSYGDFDFSGGWKCSNSFGKRDLLTKRTFGSKCIKNKVSKKQPASFGCDKRKSGFSITHIDVSVEYDVDLELHYHMEDGSKCKQVASCSSSGSTIQNTQCGGAKSVDVYLPQHDKSDKECEIGFHNIGFDCNPGKGYNPPSPPEASKPASSAPPRIPTASTPVVSKPASIPVPPTTSAACDGEYCASQPPASTPVPSTISAACDGEYCASQPPASTPVPPTTSAACDGEYCASQPPVSSTPAPSAPVPSAPATEITVSTASVPTRPATEPHSTSCGGYGQGSCEGPTVISSAPVETPPTSHSTLKVSSTVPSAAPYTDSSAPASPVPTYETSPVPQPPASAPPSTLTASRSPVCDGSYGESCEGTTAVSTPLAPPVSSGSVILSTGVPQPSSPSYSPVSPPDVLPKCMNTWLEVSGDCKNNADASCYCKNKDFTKQVIDCVSAWCGTDDETREALQYLIGICAEHVPENPGLVTDCPSYIPLNPTPASPTAPASGVSTTAGEVGSTTAAVPVTTPAPEVPSGGVTGNVPASTPAASTPCTTITYGTTTLTLPQVHFTTQTNDAGATPTQPVGLAPGTAPAQTPASTTAALYPVSGTTLATFKPTGTGGYRPTSPAEFTGAAAPFKLEAQHAIFGAILALFAL
ncbi:uncharacterized protein M421DRAFT_416544 [Didymella exigua CBS 183.55]|uniref:CFEM domain-containing protein n=1 Tax=Didymella exigua CBS 183.55 TaxID=1150837 RepID=A0A6A5S397_9PLEO|nr:uncharacterized protein M421DRAFT_416544 [Didymella exigua CBS 183.55]KAF1932946.1 hypothetical protein M421DRAFT_416544 [Didymella exigua CBS 183.55]